MRYSRAELKNDRPAQAHLVATHRADCPQAGTEEQIALPIPEPGETLVPHSIRDGHTWQVTVVAAGGDSSRRRSCIPTVMHPGGQHRRDA